MPAKTGNGLLYDVNITGTPNRIWLLIEGGKWETAEVNGMF